MSQSINSPTYIRFRELLVQIRKDAGLTQVELAEKLGRPQQFVSRYELGERRIDVGEFLEIAEHLDIEAENVIRDLREWKSQNH